MSTSSTTMPDGDGLHVFKVPEGSLTMSDVVITDNERYPVFLTGSGLTAVDPYSATGSSYTGNGLDYAFIQDMRVSTSGTWPVLDVPWYVDNLYVSGLTSPVLTVDDIEAYMEDYSSYCSGWPDSANIVLDAAASVTSSTISNSLRYGIVCNATGSTISSNNYSGNYSGDEDGC